MPANNLSVVHPMRAGDATAVIGMARELAAAVGDPEPDLSESQLIGDGFGPGRWFDCLVAEVDGSPVGYLLLCRGFEAHTGKKRLWLGDLYVRPSARRRGVARNLMATAARVALELGCDALYWELWQPNEAGAAFYREFAATQVSDLAIMRIDGARLEALATGTVM